MRITYLFAACIVLGTPATIKAQFQITGGAAVTMGNSTFFVLNNIDFVNNGQFVQGQGAGVLKFTGGSNTIISGNPMAVGQLLISKQSGATARLQTSIVVSSALTFNGGLLDLGNSIIDLGTGGAISGESDASRAFTSGTGYIESSADLNQPSGANPGNLGSTISSSQNLGFTIIKRGNAAQNGSGLANSVLRYYDITPANNMGLNATLRLQYFNAELNGFKASQLSMFKDTGTNMWADVGYTVRDTVGRYVETNSLGSFSSFTLSQKQTALAVDFLNFTVRCDNGSAAIGWQTAQAVNAKNYMVQKSVDGGIVWQPVASINVAATGSKYSYIDNNLTALQTEYRIAEYDFDGNIRYSNTELNSCAMKDMLSVYPNPVSSTATLNVNTTAPAQLIWMLFDSKGALVLSKQSTLVTGYNSTGINMAGLAKGVYTLSAKWLKNVQSVKIIKN